MLRLSLGLCLTVSSQPTRSTDTCDETSASIWSYTRCDTLHSCPLRMNTRCPVYTSPTRRKNSRENPPQMVRGPVSTSARPPVVMPPIGAPPTATKAIFRWELLLALAAPRAAIDTGQFSHICSAWCQISTDRHGASERTGHDAGAGGAVHHHVVLR